MPNTPYSFSYAVLRYVKDERRDISVPVGVALWSEEGHWVRTRLLMPDERLTPISSSDDYPFINLISRKLDNWMKQGELPYQDRMLSPYSDAWWRHLQKILIHRLRLSEPRPIDCLEPESDLEALFRTVVGPEPANTLPSVQRVLREGGYILLESLGTQTGTAAPQKVAGAELTVPPQTVPFVVPTQPTGGPAYAALSGCSG